MPIKSDGVLEQLSCSPWWNIHLPVNI